MAGMFEAVVQAGGVETRYVSRGRGTPVVVVAATAGDRARLSALMAGGQRVIEPLPPVLAVAADADAGERLGEWLRGFVEGLGLEAPRILLAAEFAPACPTIAAALTAVEALVMVESREKD